MNGQHFERVVKGTPQIGNIYVKTKRAGEHVLERIKKFLGEKLQVKVKREKAQVRFSMKLKFLEF